MAKKVAGLREVWKQCEVKDCWKRTIDGIASLCRIHKWNRVLYGHVEIHTRLRYQEYAHLVDATLKHFKTQPPPQSILESVQSFLTPPGFLKRGEAGHAKRSLLVHEMCRWQDPRYRKKATLCSKSHHRKTDYSPKGYLSVMVAIEAYIAEREGRGWPGDSEGMEKAFAISRLHKRPGRIGVSKKLAAASPPGTVEGVKYSQKINGTILRGVAARLRGYSALGVYIYQTAQVILKLPAVPRKPKGKPRGRYVAKKITPRAVPAPPPAPIKKEIRE